jgi:hypothetical protein
MRQFEQRHLMPMFRLSPMVISVWCIANLTATVTEGFVPPRRAPGHTSLLTTERQVYNTKRCVKSIGQQVLQQFLAVRFSI